MKDPAMLWYWNDWGGGTRLLSRFLKGCYMDLLEAQFNSGPLSLEEIKIVLGSDFGQAWPTLSKKFKCDNGLYFNERMEVEKSKRKAYTESRRNNRLKKDMKEHMIDISETYVPHMENRNENENKDLNEVSIEKEVVGEKTKTWRNDFETYLSQLNQVYHSLLLDHSYLEIQERLHPGIDVKLSLEKAFINFWGTEAGWNYKRGKKSKFIDWKSTLTNAIDMNRVYKKREERLPNIM